MIFDITGPGESLKDVQQEWIALRAAPEGKDYPKVTLEEPLKRLDAKPGDVTIPPDGELRSILILKSEEL